MGETGSGGEAKKPELVMTRVFDAPRELVFQVWTKAEHFQKWFAPQGFTVPSCEIDLRPGGAFRFVFRGPGGMEFPSDGEYVEVEPPSRLVWKAMLPGGLEVLTDVRFEAEGGKTKLTVHQKFAFESPATKGAPMGWTQTLDNLGRYLATL